MTVATLLLDVSRVRAGRLDGPYVLRDGAFGRCDRLHRFVERRHDVTGSQDRLSDRCDPRSQQIAIVVGALVSALVLGPILLKLNDVATVHVPRVSKAPAEDAAAALRDVENFPATLRVDPAR
mgnify:CR=1 FL=1